ncbi:MAG: ribosomal-processing cysteine protease Prp [Clostridia bacterium]|nr:ribosomal-processing cysteine protease Prp [Clostridia bacterium]
MIRVTFQRENGSITGFDCRGHAAFAAYGKDIVCAAVSVLTTTCVNAIESVAHEEAEVQVSEGSMTVRLKNAGHDAQVIMETMRQGLKDIAEEYPRNLQLIENSM